MGTQSQAYTNSVPAQQSLYPDGQLTLAFYIKCVLPVGLAAGVRYSAATLFYNIVYHWPNKPRLVRYYVFGFVGCFFWGLTTCSDFNW